MSNLPHWQQQIMTASSEKFGPSEHCRMGSWQRCAKCMLGKAQDLMLDSTGNSPANSGQSRSREETRFLFSMTNSLFTLHLSNKTCNMTYALIRQVRMCNLLNLLPLSIFLDSMCLLQKYTANQKCTEIIKLVILKKNKKTMHLCMSEHFRLILQFFNLGGNFAKTWQPTHIRFFMLKSCCFRNA